MKRFFGKPAEPACTYQREHDRLCQNETLHYAAPRDGRIHPSQMGTSPAGTLRIQLTPKICPGFRPSCTVIELHYEIPSGIQREYHPNPTVPYQGDDRTAFLPDNEEGRKLLTRFKYAWYHGHMLSVGRSQTHCKDNMTLWSTVPQKSGLAGGPFGFPDSQYIAAVNKELDDLNIPTADVCLRLLPNAASAQHPPSLPDANFSMTTPAATLPASAPAFSSANQSSVFARAVGTGSSTSLPAVSYALPPATPTLIPPAASAPLLPPAVPPPPPMNPSYNPVAADDDVGTEQTNKS
jgi:deltex-like protein